MTGALYIFRTLTAVSLILCCMPFVWHIRYKNFPAVFLIGWISLFSFSSFVNSFIWPDDDSIQHGWDGKVYCDIQVKLKVAAFAGNLGALAAIARNLARVLSRKTIGESQSERRRALLQDTMLCVGAPIFMAITHYIVQPNRYDLIPVSGCTVTVAQTLPAVFLQFIWSPIMAVVAASYSIVVIIRVQQHRRQFSEILSGSTTINKSRFWRLFGLAMILLLILVPITFFTLFQNLKHGIKPYSWKSVHGQEWQVIERIPMEGAIEFETWVSPCAGIFIFCFFGIGGEATRIYKGWLETLGVEKYLQKSSNEAKKAPNFNASKSGNSVFSITEIFSRKRKTADIERDS
ncbi:pheromone A receptor family protein [Pyronema omphalodes]|nr:pheromone A receptor family protein [Pyronema omphalodes]